MAKSSKQSSEKERKNSLKDKILGRKFLIITIFIVVVIALIPTIYFYVQYQSTQELLKAPGQASNDETGTLVELVGKLIELPKSETPTIATVSDKSKLSDQPFFANSENGDKVLIYANSKKAYIYRPSINKIIEVASVNLSNNEGSQSAQILGPNVSVTPTEVTKQFKVAIFNGTLISGFAASTQNLIESSSPNFIVISKGDANNNDYEKTIVVDLKGNPSGAASLAQVVGGSVGELPEGERTSTNADFLVILGSNK